MSLLVDHRTSYRYGDTVSMCQNVLRLRPRSSEWQEVVSHELDISPTPSATRQYMDYFGNHVTWMNLVEPHHELQLRAKSMVRLLPRRIAPVSQSTPWEAAASHMKNPIGHRQSMQAKQFIFPSPHVNWPDESLRGIQQYALESFAPGRPLLEGAVCLTERLHAEFQFTPGMTDVQTPVIDVLQSRRGVCQDFAHLQIAMLRSIGLAARYVSGYILTQPPPGQPRLVGADASHAWLAVFDPAIGWIDLDPTNGVVPLEHYVTVGWARDYGDVCPVRGITLGGTNQWLGVSVDVSLHDD